MFNKLVKNKFFETLIDKANDDFIKKDNNKYTHIFNLIENITKVSKYDIIISDVEKISNTLFYMDNEQSRSSITLFTDKPKELCTLLTNLIHEHFGKFTQMKSTITDTEYHIFYDMRDIITVYILDTYKKINIFDILNPIVINEKNYMPVNIEIIKIYHKLFLLNYFEEWNDLSKIENQMTKNYTNVYLKYLKSIIKKEIPKPCISCKSYNKMDIAFIKCLVLESLNNENYIIVNNWVMNINTNKVSDDILSIISPYNIEDDYNKIITYLSKYTQYGIYYKKNNVYIPIEKRLSVYTIYIKYPGITNNTSDKPLLEIYNNASYELVPYISKEFHLEYIKFSDNTLENKLNLKIGNYWVLLYFISIKFWIINILLNKIDVDTIYDNTKTFLKYVLKNKKNLISNHTHIGINFDEKIEKKIEISKNNIIKKNYYPELSIKNNKKYKLIATS